MSSIVVAGDTSGTVTLTVPVVAGSNTVTIPAVTGTAVISGQNSAITAGTAVASTSGTAITFTGIPSWVKRITVMLAGVSTNGTSLPLCRIGTSGGIESTGYLSCGVYTGASTSGANQTVGFALTGVSASAATLFHGNIVLTNLNGNIWTMTSILGESDNNYLTLGGGSKTLGGTLTQVQLTTVNGTDTFDAGSINILYE